MLNDEYVQVTHVKNDGSTTDAPTYYWSVDTDDKVFLLSYQDLLNADYGFENVLGPSNTRVCKTTDFAKARGSYYKRYAGNPFDGNVIYWTRSPVSDMPGYAWIVNTDGAIGRAAEHQHVNYRYASVRPAITLKYNFM